MLSALKSPTNQVGLFAVWCYGAAYYAAGFFALVAALAMFSTIPRRFIGIGRMTVLASDDENSASVPR